MATWSITDMFEPIFLLIESPFHWQTARIGRSRRALEPYHDDQLVVPPSLRTAPCLRRPRLVAATGPPHTSDPHALSATCPTHEDFDQGPPAPHIGNTHRSPDPG